MIKYILLFCILFQSFSTPACEVKKHIFLIHGIGGGIGTFGSMEKYLNKIDDCFLTTSFKYDTGNSKLSTYDFAVSFHDFVMARVNDGRISLQDKISLVMHSQGGIIGNIWLNYLKKSDMILFSQVDAFITLSTPHWGADMAKLGKSIFYTLPPGMSNPISPFGRIELNEMSYGSATIREIFWTHEQLFSNRHLRPLALAGSKAGLNLQAESDVVVPIYSSRADHYSGLSELSLSVKDDEISADAFVKTKSTPLVVVPATHIGMGKMPGIASIPSSCLTSDSCGHPSIASITQHLKGRNVASVVPDLKKFRISLYLNNHSEQKIADKDVRLFLIKSENSRITTFRTAFRGKAHFDEGTAFTLEGNTSKKGTVKVILQVKIKNKISRYIEVPAEGGYTSVLNLNLID